jgi:hypothetical protein
MTQNSIRFPDKSSRADRKTVAHSVEKRVSPALAENVDGTMVPKYMYAKEFHSTAGRTLKKIFTAYFFLGSVKKRKRK